MDDIIPPDVLAHCILNNLIDFHGSLYKKYTLVSKAFRRACIAAYPNADVNLSNPIKSLFKKFDDLIVDFPSYWLDNESNQCFGIECNKIVYRTRYNNEIVIPKDSDRETVMKSINVYNCVIHGYYEFDYYREFLDTIDNYDNYFRLLHTIIKNKNIKMDTDLVNQYIEFCYDYDKDCEDVGYLKYDLLGCIDILTKRRDGRCDWVWYYPSSIELQKHIENTRIMNSKNPRTNVGVCRINSWKDITLQDWIMCKKWICLNGFDARIA